MFRFTKLCIVFRNRPVLNYANCRTFLSQAYYCNEVWEQRLNLPLLKNVNLEHFYLQLDLGYQKVKNISAVDVDVFCNAVSDDSFTDELLDLTHKLRLSADTSNTLKSTPHAVVRFLLNANKTDVLLNILDDRLNYGIFLDYYTGNLLMDVFWKNKDYLSGARVASQFMLQETFDHLLCNNLSLLHCYKFLQNPVQWPVPPPPEEPEEEVKIRVPFVRNPYDDNHFDLKDGNRLVGKTMLMVTKGLTDVLNRSLHAVGVALYHNSDTARKLIINKSFLDGSKLYNEILSLIPDDNPLKSEIAQMATEVGDIENLLQDSVRSAEKICAEKDIADQCKRFQDWELERENALRRQQERLTKLNRLEKIKETQKSLKEREMLLWFFENEEKLDLQIEAKEIENASRLAGKTIKENKIEADYIPPEVGRRAS